MSTNNGYSYKITITAEEIRNPTKLSGASKMASSFVQPPKMDARRTTTNFTEYTTTVLPRFAFDKIVEPRFDGIGQYTGQPVNFPHFISEHHMISIMRATERLLAPKYMGSIKGSGNSTRT